MNAAHAAPITKRRRWRAFVADRQGATAVEFALVATPFIGLLVGIIQTFLVFFAQQLLETSVKQSSRLILTGQAQAQSLSPSQFASVVCSNLPILFNCAGLMIDVQVAGSWSSASAAAPTLTFDANGNVTNAWQFNVGNPGDIVIVRVMYLWPVFAAPLMANLSDANRLIMASSAFQNEAYINS